MTEAQASRDPTTDQSAQEDALAHAEDQIEAMTGDLRTPVRFRLLDQRHGVAEEKRRPAAIQLFGSLADEALCDQLWRLNCDGYDAYVVAQGVRASLPAPAAVSQADIEEARVLFADGDDHDPIPADEFHIAPTAVLRRENSDRHFWLLWRVEDMRVAAIRDMQQRIVQRYGTDRTVCDPARIIRLAGFASHKREEKTRYIFEAGSGKSARSSAHDGMLPKVQRAPIETGDGGEDYISEERLRLALASIDPSCGKPGDACRNTWIATLGAIVDAKIGREDRTYMEDFDKFALADEWSSAGLGSFGTPASYNGFDDVAATMEHLSRQGQRKRAGIGSIVRAAKAAGMDELEHRRLQKREPFTSPANLLQPAAISNTAQAEPAVANSALPAKPEGLYDGPEYGTRPEVSIRFQP